MRFLNQTTLYCPVPTYLYLTISWGIGTWCQCPWARCRGQRGCLPELAEVIIQNRLKTLINIKQTVSQDFLPLFFSTNIFWWSYVLEVPWQLPGVQSTGESFYCLYDKNFVLILICELSIWSDFLIWSDLIFTDFRKLCDLHSVKVSNW